MRRSSRTCASMTREYCLGKRDAPLTLRGVHRLPVPVLPAGSRPRPSPQLKKNYIDTGKLRFIVRDLPLSFHSSARPAAEAAHCAAEQGKFWEMHHALLTGDEPLANGGIDQRAKALGLDLERLHACTQAARYESAIARNAAAADALGIHGTPAFVIGRIVNGALEGQLVSGAQPYDEFDAALKQLLAQRE